MGDAPRNLLTRRAALCGLAGSAIVWPVRWRNARAATGAAFADDDIAGVPMLRFRRLVAGYPDLLDGIGDGHLVWKDGTRMSLDDGVRGKSFEQMLRAGSLADQLRQTSGAAHRRAIPPSTTAPDASGTGLFSPKCMATAARTK